MIGVPDDVMGGGPDLGDGRNAGPWGPRFPSGPRPLNFGLDFPNATDEYGNVEVRSSLSYIRLLRVVSLTTPRKLSNEVGRARRTSIPPLLGV